MWHVLLRMHAFWVKKHGGHVPENCSDWFSSQLHRNVEAYMDDIVVKTKDQATLIQDLEETFSNLRKIRLKLNPETCSFGVPYGKLLGFFVSHRGIEANPDKIKAIDRFKPRSESRTFSALTAALLPL
jgi:hypothetical protein